MSKVSIAMPWLLSAKMICEELLLCMSLVRVRNMIVYRGGYCN